MVEEDIRCIMGCGATAPAALRWRATMLLLAAAEKEEEEEEQQQQQQQQETRPTMRCGATAAAVGQTAMRAGRVTAATAALGAGTCRASTRT